MCRGEWCRGEWCVEGMMCRGSGVEEVVCRGSVV